MENFDKELDIRLPYLANINVTPMLKSIQILTEELCQLFTPELTLEPLILFISSAPTQLLFIMASPTPQTSFITLLSSKVTELLIVDPIPCFEPLTT